MSLFCKHEWEKVSETTLPCALDNLKALGMESETYYTSQLRKKYILVLGCKKCGKLDKTVEVTP